jgi:phage tail-like protein
MPETIASAKPFVPPLQTFRFRVAFKPEPIGARGSGKRGGAPEDLCEGAFSEVTGLEASMEVKSIREGGANNGAHQRAGQITFSTVVLKRGVTTSRDLWRWWSLLARGALAHRLTVRITLQDPAGAPVMTWRLERALPVKFKAADFNARATEVGIEELHFVHEGLFPDNEGA